MMELSKIITIDYYADDQLYSALFCDTEYNQHKTVYLHIIYFLSLQVSNFIITL